MRLPTAIRLVFSACALASSVAASDAEPAQAVNQFGLNLLRRLPTAHGNVCFSPYSVECALAMTFAGADGDTRAEMAKTLHLPEKDDAVHERFAQLRRSLDRLRTGKSGVAWHEANRLFVERRFPLNPSFQKLLADAYGSPAEALDFSGDPAAARRRINRWVAEQTADKIQDLIPPDGVTSSTPMVLANAIYLKAAWADKFNPKDTSPEPFRVDGANLRNVPTMRRTGRYGYARKEGLTTVSLPYSDPDLQLVILMPDSAGQFSALEASLNPSGLTKLARLEPQLLNLHVPKFKASSELPLRETLGALGMRQAFESGADFRRMSTGGAQMHISQVYHQAVCLVDEQGTEATAATAVAMTRSAAPGPAPEPIVVKIDRPFLFLVQHAPTGTCLFLGRIMEPK